LRDGSVRVLIFPSKKMRLEYFFITKEYCAFASAAGFDFRTAGMVAAYMEK
jgi:hypothetical protein